MTRYPNTPTATGAVTLPARSVGQIQRALALVDAAETAMNDAGEAASDASLAGEVDRAVAHHHSWEHAREAQIAALSSVVAELRVQLAANGLGS